jgi:eukaryotic-like serine/threonine-protein kinase
MFLEDHPMVRLTRSLVVVTFMVVPTLTLIGCQRGGKTTEHPPSTNNESGGKGTEQVSATTAKNFNYQDGPLGMKFVKMPKGTFWMGWGSIGKPESKQVEIKQDFELAAYTVTQEQWETVMGKNPSYFSRQGKYNDKVQNISDGELKQFPAEMVSWDDAQEFLRKLNTQEKGNGWLYRLPTGAEWEYACRGGATSKEECSFDFYLEKPTNDLSSNQANFDGAIPAGKATKGPSLGRPAKVGSYAPNKLGLYDMHGNVFQWCEDLHVEGSGRSGRMIRGGGWGGAGVFLLTAFHVFIAPTDRSEFLGFRIVRVLSN